MFAILKNEDGRLSQANKFLSEPVVEIIVIDWAKVTMHSSSSIWLALCVIIYSLQYMYNLQLVPLKLSQHFKKSETISYFLQGSVQTH